MKIVVDKEGQQVLQTLINSYIELTLIKAEKQGENLLKEIVVEEDKEEQTKEKENKEKKTG